VYIDHQYIGQCTGCGHSYAIDYAKTIAAQPIKPLRHPTSTGQLRHRLTGRYLDRIQEDMAKFDASAAQSQLEPLRLPRRLSSLPKHSKQPAASSTFDKKQPMGPPSETEMPETVQSDGFEVARTSSLPTTGKPPHPTRYEDTGASSHHSRYCHVCGTEMSEEYCPSCQHVGCELCLPMATQPAALRQFGSYPVEPTQDISGRHLSHKRSAAAASIKESPSVEADGG
jgi:hypothetical protein